MRKFLFILFILPALACSSQLTQPIDADLVASPAAASPLPSPMVETPTTNAATITCTVTAQALHVRDAPNIQGLVLAWLVKGEQLQILPDQPIGDWVRVQTAGNVTGWINSIYCER